MTLLHRILLIVLRPDYSLDSIFQDQIRHLVAADESAGQSAPVNGDDQDFLCKGAGASVLPGECKPDRCASAVVGGLTVEVGV
jgi:hypothetical protein